MKPEKQLYQWDVNQYLTELQHTAEFVDYPIGNEVIRIKADGTRCRIPDEVLQTYGGKTCYERYPDGTYRAYSFSVLYAPKPPDYVYTPEERTTFEALTARVDAAIEEIKRRADSGEFTPKKGVDYFTDAEKNELMEGVSSGAVGEFRKVVDTATTEYNDNHNSKLAKYNANASEKLNTYDTNAEQHTTDYNRNAAEKLTEYNDNATEKLNAYNANADNRVAEFNSHTEQIHTDIGEVKSDLYELIKTKTVDIDSAPTLKNVMFDVSVGDNITITNNTNAVIEVRFVTVDNDILQKQDVTANNKVIITSTVNAHHIRFYASGTGRVVVESDNAKVTKLESDVENLKPLIDIFEKSSNIANTNNDKVEYWFDSTGNIVYDGDALYAVSDYIKVSPNTSYGIKGCIKVAFYDATKNALGVRSVFADDGSVFITTDDTEYVSLGYKVAYKNDKKVVLEKGTVIPTYTEYFDDTIKFDFIKRYFPNYSRKTFYRDVNYNGIPIGNFYTASDNDSSFSEQTTLEQFYTQLDSLIDENNSDGYVTKKALGTSSYGDTQLYEYDFTPIKPSAPNAKEMPKIIIFSGQHGGEESNIYGMYYFINDLLTKWDTSPVLDYIRNHIIIKWIPIANPYGFENNSYLNANGVNLNRNYDLSGFPAYPDAEQGTSQYGGVTPFDQPETQIIRDFVNDNLDAVIGIDHHSFGGSSITEWERVNWITMVNSNDRFYNSMADCLSYHFSNMTGHLSKQFNLSNGNESLGYYSVESNTFPSADAYMLSRGIASITFEGFNGFKNSPSFTTDVYKANAELIGNLFITYLHHVENTNYTFIE